MKREVKIKGYCNAAREFRWSVWQVFLKSETTEGHETLLRQNFISWESAQRYADRVVRVGFEYA